MKHFRNIVVIMHLYSCLKMSLCECIPLDTGDFASVCRWIQEILRVYAVTYRSFCECIPLHTGHFALVVPEKAALTYECVNIL